MCRQTGFNSPSRSRRSDRDALSTVNRRGASSSLVIGLIAGVAQLEEQSLRGTVSHH
jgi:hypothetical protein